MSCASAVEVENKVKKAMLITITVFIKFNNFTSREEFYDAL